MKSIAAILIAAIVLVTSVVTAGDRMDAIPASGTNVRVIAYTSTNNKQCELDKPQLEKFRRQGVEIVNIDVTNDPRFSDRFGVSPPLYVVQKNGVEVGRAVESGTLGVILIGFIVWLCI